MGFPAIWSTLQPFQICIYNSKFSKWTFSNDSQLIGKRFITNFHASLESTCKSRISNTSTRCQNQRGQSQPFHAQLRKVSFALIYFMGFPAIWSTLQPFQICIYNSKFSKWTFSNDSQLMGKRFITNFHVHHWRVHATVEFPIPPPDVRTRRVSITTFPCSTQKCKFCIDIFYGVSCNMKHITAISNLHLQ